VSTEDPILNQVDIVVTWHLVPLDSHFVVAHLSVVRFTKWSVQFKF